MKTNLLFICLFVLFGFGLESNFAQQKTTLDFIQSPSMQIQNVEFNKHVIEKISELDKMEKLLCGIGDLKDVSLKGSTKISGNQMVKSFSIDKNVSVQSDGLMVLSSEDVTIDGNLISGINQMTKESGDIIIKSLGKIVINGKISTINGLTASRDITTGNNMLTAPPR